ncbi:MAG: 30S ribosomal protein S12 methylthiotransferase RimO [Gammaproteobacteria bacterium]|nr:30S ribosomal protein S12 methylthiotransferase RimO [Gammaproteobacteria bacterium]
MSTTTRPPKVGFVSLGCPKATVDSEHIITQLRAEGYELSSSYEDSDLVVVNTCGFIDSAVEESLDTIGEALAENGKVIVTGCLGAKDTVVLDNYPNVLAVTGPHAQAEVMQVVHQHLPKPHDPYTDLVPPAGVKLTPKHYSYLKISEGCNHGCTFCIIPDLRGKLVSRDISSVMTEAENLVNGGCGELLVISQDTSAYGVDLKYRTDFHGTQPIKTNMEELAKNLGALGVWVRMHYVYPYPSVDNIIPLMADGLILPYLDIPFQHASQSVLKNMKRPASAENVLKRIENWRQICPDITLRSTFITGFPGETEQDFQILLDFLDEAQLDRVGAFAYSDVEGAKANALAGAVPEELRKERLQRFMLKQAEISAAKLQQKIGQRMTVHIDGYDEESGEVLARSKADAPDIDGMVILPAIEGFQAGDFLEVIITDADEHDLYANPVHPDDDW